jgi:hypothetical protein
MKGYRDVKAMKQSGHQFMADGGFTGSAGVQSVKPYVRKPASGKPSKPDFVRRATTPGGLANGGTMRGATKPIGDDIGERKMRAGETRESYNERQYQAERAGRVPKWNDDGRDDYEMESGRKPKGAAYANGGMAPKASSAVTLAAGSYAKGGKADMKQDKAMVKKAVHKHESAMHPGKPMTPLKTGGLTAAANFQRGKADSAKLDRASMSQPKKFASGGKAAYSRKPMIGC